MFIHASIKDNEKIPTLKGFMTRIKRSYIFLGVFLYL